MVRPPVSGKVLKDALHCRNNFSTPQNNVNQKEANVAFICYCNMLVDSADSVMYLY